jgi:hypothetical protein
MAKLTYKLKTQEFTVKVRAGTLICMGVYGHRDESAVVAQVVLTIDGRSVAQYEIWADKVPCITGNARKIKRLARSIAKHFAGLPS